MPVLLGLRKDSKENSCFVSAEDLNSSSEYLCRTTERSLAAIYSTIPPSKTKLHVTTPLNSLGRIYDYLIHQWPGSNLSSKWWIFYFNRLRKNWFFSASVSWGPK